MAKRAGKGRPSNFTDKQVRLLLKRLGGLDPGLRGNLNEKQITKRSQAFVGAHLDPMRRESEAAIERRSQRGTGAISGYTAEHEAQLGKIPGLVDADYNRQAADEEALQRGLTGYLEGSGRQYAGELGAKLQAAGIEAAPPMDVKGPLPPQPVPPGTGEGPPGARPLPIDTPGPGPGGQFSGALATLGRSASGHAAADTYATRSRIGSEGASQRAYAHELPGIAALGGRAAVRDLQLQLNRELSDRIGEINAQGPGMAAEEAERLRDRNVQKAQLRGSFLNTYLDRELQRQVAAAGTGLDYAKLAQAEQLANQAEAGRNRRATQAERGRNQRAANSQAAQNERARLAQQGMGDRQARRLQASGRQYDEKLSRQKGHLVDKRGRPIKRSNGDWIPFKEPPKGSNNPYQ